MLLKTVSRSIFSITYGDLLDPPNLCLAVSA
jgi:hypothetical protein